MMRRLFAGIAVASLEICARGAGGADMPELAIACYPDAKPAMLSLTFDDGTWDHYSIAAPLMEKYGFRGIFSIIPERLGNAKYMNWSHVRDLKARGHDIANHSMSHANLVQVLVRGDTNEINRQIVASLDVFEENAGFRPAVFCFPYTAFNDELYRRVIETGQEPIKRMRFVFKSTTPFEEFEAFLDNAITNRLFVALLFHGIAPDGRGWEPFREEGGFERVLQKLASREADLHVGGYRANMDYDKRRDASELVKTESTLDKNLYRLAQREGRCAPPGQLAIILDAERGGEAVNESREENASGAVSGEAARLPPPCRTAVWIGDRIAPLRTNALGVVYFSASIGDVITLEKTTATSQAHAP